MAICAVVLTGCSSETKSDEPTNSAPPTSEGPRSGDAPKVELTDAAALLDQASKTTRLTSAVHMALTVDPEFKGLPVEDLNADVVVTPEPAAKGDGKFRLTDEYKEAEFVIVGGTLYIKEAGESEWETSPAGERSYDPSVVLSEDKGLANVLAKFKNPKVSGTEERNGVESVKITGTLNSADFEAIFPTQGPGALQGEHPATAYIAAAAPYNLVELSINTKDGDITLTTSKWDETVAITKPDGA
ncbi:LppX_LprAFG lipoprotein [Gordonia liuliyuniae]|uniref:LppX_LprAFG lipoprotein n=1 Tax=Gordonia liuliyuniae TaxID=2911517 RepID=A0ABS9IQ49_9ACTN|nr:LppX_LprAFG lipoprotein [Gordonia liuliyuniae]MCF8587687.1 LppX_LprAFG lipoprotein [Gordonia liuliyuniae]